MGICAYCARQALTGTEKPEHPIPAALGSSLEVQTVCNRCNEWAGREIDQPFLNDDWVREHRSQSGVIDPRRGRKGRAVSSPMFSGGETEDGDFVSLDETGKPRLRSRIIDLGDNRFQIRTDSVEEMERLKKRVEQRTGKKITDESISHSSSRPRIQGRIVVDTLLWQREAAKIGLAVASHVYPLSWRTGIDASLLREWLHGIDASSADGKARGLALGSVNDSPFELIVDGPSHLLLFIRSGESTHLAVALLGSMLFTVPVNTTGAPTPRIAWKLDPHHPRKDGEASFDALLAGAAKRFIAEHGGDQPDSS